MGTWAQYLTERARIHGSLRGVIVRYAPPQFQIEGSPLNVGKHAVMVRDKRRRVDSEAIEKEVTGTAGGDHPSQFAVSDWWVSPTWEQFGNGWIRDLPPSGPLATRQQSVIPALWGVYEQSIPNSGPGWSVDVSPDTNVIFTQRTGGGDHVS